MRALATSIRARRHARAWTWFVVRAGRLDYWLRPHRRDRWGGPFNGQAFRQRMFADVVEQLAVAAIVETGTYRGTTTAFLRRAGRAPVYSFEIDPHHYGFAAERLAALPDIHVRCCDSRIGLLDLASSRALPSGSVFFYLDAHGVGDLPLAHEIALAFRHWPSAVVMVDDFAVPDDPGYGFDDLGAGQMLNLDYLGDHDCLPADAWFPRCDASAETGARRGCVVLTRSADIARRLDAVPTLRRWPNATAGRASGAT